MGDNRIVFHIDVNSAFLSWTAVDLLQRGQALDIRTVPSVIGGDESTRHGVVLAKSTPAKAFKIDTGEPLFSARKKCPGLITLPSDFALYTRMSRKFLAVLEDYSPTVQQFSIDECFLDYTGLEGVYGPPVEAAYALKDRIYTQLGFTVNIGVAPNKILAKMAGELEKPDRVHTIFRDELATKLWPQPVRNLFMVGEKSEKILAAHGITTIGQLANAPQHTLSALLKSHGIMLWHYANGVDSTAVTPVQIVKDKSCSASTTLSRDCTEESEAHLVLLKLCDSVCMRMRTQGLQCRNVSITLKYSDFSVVSKQSALPRPTQGTEELYHHSKRLLKLLWSGQAIRLIGFAVSDLSAFEETQISMFEVASQERQKKLDQVRDTLRLQFGTDAVSYGAQLEGDHISNLERYFPNPEKKK